MQDAFGAAPKSKVDLGACPPIALLKPLSSKFVEGKNAISDIIGS